MSPRSRPRITLAPAPPPDALRLLGTWRLRWDGVERPAVPDSVRRLVALLALRGPASRYQLAATLWPTRTAASGRAALRHALSTAGHRLPGLVRAGDGAALAPDLAVDTDRLLALAAAVNAPAPPVAASGELRAVLVDSRELLPGWYDDWVEDERARLTAVRLAALARLSEQRLAAGATAEALRTAEAAVRLDPLSEDAATLVIRAHVAMGNPALAVRCWEDLRRRYRHDLGIEPAPPRFDRLTAT